MYLRSIEIQGFKSFADKTTVTFLPPKNGKQTVTAIVGPNGSGKSNIADAIRWVMGEQKMKMLRGKKSDDIIFSGSETKGKMGMASVSLTIDNADHALPVEYDELTITRRLYRSGEGEYLVNGQPVRLLDLQLLLAKAQFGQGSYSIVGQGMIDRMLLQSPAERKVFFDEASGIKELQIKRHQAALKLARTKEHMAQAETLLQEVSPRLKTLSRQVKKLEERHELERTLREKQEKYYVTLWRQFDDRAGRIRSELHEFESKYSAATEQLRQIQETLAALASGASREDAFRSLQSQYETIMQEKHRIDRERVILQGRLATEYRVAGQESLNWLDQKIETAEAESQHVDREVEALEREERQLREALKKKQETVAALLQERSQLQTKLYTLEQQVIEQKHEQQLFQAIGLRAVQAILEERHRFGTVYGAVAQLGSVDTAYQVALDVAAGSHISSIIVGDDRVASACIEYLRREQLGTATFLPITKIRPRPPRGVEEFLGRKGVHGLAVDLVRFDEQFASIFSFIFGSTLIVEDLSTARDIGVGAVRMVTLAGDVLETSGTMKGGYRRPRQQGMGFGNNDRFTANKKETHRDAEAIAAVTQSIATISQTYETTERDVRDVEASLQVIVAKKGLFMSQKQERDRELSALKQERSLATMSPDEYTSTMKTLSEEKGGLDAAMESCDAKLADVQKSIATFHAEEEKKKQNVFALQDEMQIVQQTVNRLVEQKNAEQIELAKCETKQEDLSNEVYQEMHAGIETIVKRGIEPLAIEMLETVQVDIQKLKYTLALIGGIDEEVVKEYEETKERHHGLMTQLEDLQKALGDLETMVVELDTIMKKRRDKAFRHIRREFSRYFSVLFEGGKADLIELYGDEEESQASHGSSEEAGEEVLAAEQVEEEGEGKKKKKQQVLIGIDVIARPPGKKIEHLQALSGGERTMTSIALISAILKTNPSPFILLDEVEAALDEANTLRFTKILRELASESQCILITHNRATMHAADVLYGVTMGNNGTSHLLSVKLHDGEAALS